MIFYMALFADGLYDNLMPSRQVMVYGVTIIGGYWGFWVLVMWH